MSLAYVAALPIPLLCPQLQLCIGLVALELDATLSGALALNASLSIQPPTVAIYLAAEIEAEAQLALSVELMLPTVKFDLSVSLDLEVSLNLSLSLLLDFEFGLGLDAFLHASIGLYGFTYQGPGDAMGADLTTSLATTWPGGPPTSGDCHAIVFGATSPIAQQQLAKFLDGYGFAPGLVPQAAIGALADLSLVTGKATLQASAAISAKLDAQAKVSAALKVGVNIPTPTVTLEALAKFQAELTAELGLAPPAIQAALSATASLAAGISAEFGFMADLGACLTRWDATLFCYTYSGPGTGLGAAVTAALATTWGDGSTPTSSECAAVVLATTDSASAGIVGAFFGGL